MILNLLVVRRGRMHVGSLVVGCECVRVVLVYVCVCVQALSEEHQRMIDGVPVEEQRVIH